MQQDNGNVYIISLTMSLNTFIKFIYDNHWFVDYLLLQKGYSTLGMWIGCSKCVKNKKELESNDGDSHLEVCPYKKMVFDVVEINEMIYLSLGSELVTSMYRHAISAANEGNLSFGLPPPKRKNMIASVGKPYMQCEYLDSTDSSSFMMWLSFYDAVKVSLCITYCTTRK
jgi:hypothetical protein